MTFQGVVEGVQDYRSIGIGSIVQQVIGYGGGTIVLLVSRSLTALLCWNVLVGVGIIIYWFRRARMFFPRLTLLPSLDRFSVQKTFNFSSWQFVNNLFGIAAGNADRFLLATPVNIAAVGVYGVARKVMDVVRGVALPIIRTFLPATSARSNIPGESERFILDYGWAISMLAGCVYAIGFILGPAFLRLWVGDEVGVPAGPVVKVFMATILLELPSGVIAQYMLGHGLTRSTTLINIVTSTISLALMAILIKDYGMLGAAWSGFFGLLVTRPPFHIWVFKKYFSGVDSWFRCFIDTYGVLLSVCVGGILGYLSYTFLIEALGNMAGFAVSVIVSPCLVVLGFIATEIMVMGHRRKILALLATLLTKMQSLRSAWASRAV